MGGIRKKNSSRKTMTQIDEKIISVSG